MYAEQKYRLHIHIDPTTVVGYKTGEDFEIKIQIVWKHYFKTYCVYVSEHVIHFQDTVIKHIVFERTRSVDVTNPSFF